MSKCNRIRRAGRATILLVLLWFCYCAYGSLKLRNYENDPNMAKGMEYDLGEHPGDYEKADRAKVEKYYLEYLKNVRESFQKARVYVRLGTLYATGFDIREGEKADLEKARFYLRKALELEPERIDWATIQARTMLASMEQTREGRIKAGIEVYGWLLTINEEEIRKKWLPLTPDNNTPTPLQMKKAVRAWGGLRSSTVPRNIMAGIKSLPDAEAEKFLVEIAERFGSSELEKLAHEQAAERGIWIPAEPVTEKTERGAEEHMEEEIAEEGAGSAWVYWVAAGVIGVAAAIAILVGRKKTTGGN